MVHFRKLIKEMVSHKSALRPSFKEVIQRISDYANYKELRENEVVIKICDKIKLGQGGFGVVLYGTLTSDKAKSQKYSVALKRIDVTYSSSNQREEAALKELRHPNVIRLFHATSDHNFRYTELSPILHVQNMIEN